jgi:hypothetical protein
MRTSNIITKYLLRLLDSQPHDVVFHKTTPKNKGQLDITVTAIMNHKANPDLVSLLYEYLPYRSLQNHALVSGDHLYHLVPSEKLIVSILSALSCPPSTKRRQQSDVFLLLSIPKPTTLFRTE